MSAGQIHFVTVKPSENRYFNGNMKFECRGDRSAKCHQYPDCDCDSWSDGHEHPFVAHKECWMQGWFDNAGGSSYEGEEYCDMSENGLPPEMDRSGPINVRFEEDYVAWEFRDEAEVTK